MKKQDAKQIALKREKFNKLYKEVKKIIKPLNKMEAKICAAHFYGFLKIHRKYLKNGFYDEMWHIFRSMKEQGLEGSPDYKKLGDCGAILVSNILYDDPDEFELIENIIALHKLLDYLTDKER